jgi:hypothetical protein
MAAMDRPERFEQDELPESLVRRMSAYVDVNDPMWSVPDKYLKYYDECFPLSTWNDDPAPGRPPLGLIIYSWWLKLMTLIITAATRLHFRS